MTTQEKLNNALEKLARMEMVLITIRKLSDSKAHVRSDRVTLALINAHAERWL